MEAMGAAAGRSEDISEEPEQEFEAEAPGR